MRPSWVLALLAAVLVTDVPRARAAGPDRLPDDTEPESYALSVEPDPAAGTFAGQAVIGIRVRVTTTAIVLNARGLDVSDVSVTDRATGRDVALRSWHCGRERVTVDVDGHVLADRGYAVRMRFGGRLGDDGTGFFRTSYNTSGAAQDKWLSATQFKPTHARSAFPCYDEPRFRTPFNISIKRKRNEIALSNMPIATETDGDNNSTWVHFAQTPPMPTYAVAYFVGEFERLNDDGNRLGPIDVYSHLGSLYQIESANVAAPGLLAALEQYTGVEYALPKLNLLAVPDLGTAVTATWGLTACREKSLFIDKNTNTEMKMLMEMTIERAAAHQWFSGLVTPSQWQFDWLHEGFATYLEYFATATFEPDWRLEHLFVVNVLQAALEQDQKLNFTSISAVQTDESVYEAFGKTPYNRGAAVLRMLYDWVGDKVFRKALKLYFNKNQYSAVNPEHLWNAFDNALLELTKSNLNGQNVHTIMSTWTKQIGYPVVNVEKMNKSLVLTQKRFSIRSSDVNDTTKWFIRTSFTTDKIKSFNTESAPFIWLDPAVPETTVSVDEDVKWHIFNVQSLGLYRVNYTEDNWASLINQLNVSLASIHVVNRAQLIDDSFNLARAGLLNYTVPLSLIKYLDQENDVIPWFLAMKHLNYVLDRMACSDDGYVDVLDFVSELASVAFQKLNKLAVESSDDGDRYPLINVGWNVFSKWACSLDDDNCVKMALKYFRRWRDGEEIPANIKDVVLCTGLRSEEIQGDWTKMLELYKFSKTYSEKQSALTALACTKNPMTLLKNLELILTEQFPVDPKDYQTYFNALSSMTTGRYVLTGFLQNHLVEIVRNVSDGQNIVIAMYSELAPKVVFDYEITKMSQIAHTYLTLYDFGSQESPFTEYYDEVEMNEKWFDSYSTTIREFIRPGSTIIPETSTTASSNTTQNPPAQDSSASSNLDSCMILLQLLVLSVSVKLLVCIN